MPYTIGAGAASGSAAQDQVIAQGTATKVLDANPLRKEAIVACVNGTAAPARVAFDNTVDEDVGIPVAEDQAISLCYKGELWIAGSGGAATVAVSETT